MKPTLKLLLQRKQKWNSELEALRCKKNITLDTEVREDIQRRIDECEELLSYINERILASDYTT